MVKLIKLDGRHNLYRKGYRYAFMMVRFSSESNKIERAVKELEGFYWDNTFLGKPKQYSRPYYVGFKHESTATMAMLKLA